MTGSVPTCADQTAQCSCKEGIAQRSGTWALTAGAVRVAEGNLKVRLRLKAQMRSRTVWNPSMSRKSTDTQLGSSGNSSKHPELTYLGFMDS